MVKKKKKIIGYLFTGNKVKPLNEMLLKTGAYVKSYDGQTKWMYFFIENDELPEKYKTIRDKVSADIKMNFNASLPIIKII